MPYIAVIVLALFLSPLAWIYEHTGGIGLLLALCLGVAAILAWGGRINQKKAEEEERMANERKEQYNKLVLHILHTPIQPQDAQKLYRSMAKASPVLASLLRDVQILRESMQIALASKKMDIAVSRRDLARETHQRIQGEGAALLTDETMEEISQALARFERALVPAYCANVANEFITKAEKLKTLKAKQKYAARAQLVIAKGLPHAADTDYLFLEAKHRVEQYSQSLGMSSIPE